MRQGENQAIPYDLALLLEAPYGARARGKQRTPVWCGLPLSLAGEGVAVAIFPAIFLSHWELLLEVPNCTLVDEEHSVTFQSVFPARPPGSVGYLALEHPDTGSLQKVAGEY